jgi:hypothetical protein
VLRLDRFAEIVPDQDVTWIQSHSADLATAPAEPPRALRLRLRTINLVRAYQQKGRSFPGWENELQAKARGLVSAVQ